MQPAPAADGKVTVNSGFAAFDSCYTGQAHSQLLLLMRVIRKMNQHRTILLAVRSMYDCLHTAQQLALLTC
jgi:hypothetical protein